MAKIIDFEEAKKELQKKRASANIPVSYNIYISKLETVVSSISKLTQNQIDAISKCKSVEEYDLIYGKIKELNNLYDPILTKIDKSGLTNSDKERLKENIYEHRI